MEHPLVVVMGASGAVGSAVARALEARGARVRCVVRAAHKAAGLPGDVVVLDPARDDLAPALAGADIVVSALGGSVGMHLRDRASYDAVDRAITVRIIDAAKTHGVRRFVTVGVALGADPSGGYARTRYVRAHEDAVAYLRASGLDARVTRPTGIFTALDDFLLMGVRGLGTVIGDGRAKTNPVHVDDVAAACVHQALDDDAEADLSVGGPDVMTREELLRLAFRVAGKPARLVHVPPALLRVMARLMRPLHPRLGELMEFVVEVSTHDGVAPARGARTLEEHWRARVRQLSA